MVSVRQMLFIFNLMDLTTAQQQAIPSILMPTAERLILTPVDPHYINCEPGLTHYELPGDDLIHFMAASPNPRLKTKEGHLCTKQRWTTICYEGFFGEVSETGSIEPMEISDNECLDSIILYKENRLKTPHYPLPACGWLKTNYNHQDFVIVVSHEVKIDLYNLEEIDPLFHDGRCNKTVCKTVYPNIKWISSKSDIPICDINRVSLFTLVVRKGGDPDQSMIRGQYIPQTTLTGACKSLKYCGVTGIRTRYGHFFKIASSDFVGQLAKTLEKLPICDPRVQVILNNNQIKQDDLELTEDLLIKAEKCEDVKDRLMDGESIKPRDLIYLSQSSPGPGYGFVLINNTYWITPVFYELMYNVSSICKSLDSCTVKYMKGPNVQGQWSPPHCGITPNTTDPDIIKCLWVNGLVITNRGIVQPRNNLFKAIWEQMYSEEYQIQWAEHIITRHLEDKYSTMKETDRPNYQSKTVGKWMSSIGHSIEAWIVRTVIIVTVISILYCVIRCWCLRPTIKQMLPPVSYNSSTDRVQIHNSRQMQLRGTHWN
ncbi:glycoprotein [Orgi virus]|uniref:Glycoprotein n=1 Tax=Orgi virus TaxID=1911434 RepID=A0A2Z2CF54_9RHAB|nr:glycoprotein [Orgi virus]AOX47518.1 glycoprotein [Orgi virus]